MDRFTNHITGPDPGQNHCCGVPEDWLANWAWVGARWTSWVSMTRVPYSSFSETESLWYKILKPKPMSIAGSARAHIEWLQKGSLIHTGCVKSQLKQMYTTLTGGAGLAREYCTGINRVWVIGLLWLQQPEDASSELHYRFPPTQKVNVTASGIWMSSFYT